MNKMSDEMVKLIDEMGKRNVHSYEPQIDEFFNIIEPSPLYDPQQLVLEFMKCYKDNLRTQSSNLGGCFSEGLLIIHDYCNRNKLDLSTLERLEREYGKHKREEFLKDKLGKTVNKRLRFVLITKLYMSFISALNIVLFGLFAYLFLSLSLGPEYTLSLSLSIYGTALTLIGCYAASCFSDQFKGLQKNLSWMIFYKSQKKIGNLTNSLDKLYKEESSRLKKAAEKIIKNEVG